MKSMLEFTPHPRLRDDRLVIFCMAFVLGAGASFLLFIYFLQTPVVSLRRVALALAVFAVLSAGLPPVLQWIFSKYRAAGIRSPVMASVYWALVSLMMLPHFFPDVPYPLLLPFRRRSRVEASFSVADGSNASIRLRDIWVETDLERRRDFALSGDWERIANDYVLHPGQSGGLAWRGNVGERNFFVVSARDVSGTISINWDGERESTDLRESPLRFKKFFAPPVWLILATAVSQVVCAAVLLLALGYFLLKISPDRKGFLPALFLVFVLLSVYTVFSQFENPEIKSRFSLMVIGRHQSVLNGTAGNPWEYRILAEWLVEGWAHLLGLARTKDGYFYAFFSFRVLQNILIYALAYRFFGALKISFLNRSVGIAAMTGILLTVFFQSDLSLNTYFDLVFYLAFCLLVLSNAYPWMPILAFLASWNRETSALMPVIALAAWFFSVSRRRRDLGYVILTFAAWALPFVAVRWLYPNQELIEPYGYSPGLELFMYNLTLGSLALISRTLGFAPIYGLFAYQKWEPYLKRLFLIIVPAWFAVHFFWSAVAETRLFLVPQVVVFLPGALIFLDHIGARAQSSPKINNGR
jgi:hypothetical protein